MILKESSLSTQLKRLKDRAGATLAVSTGHPRFGLSEMIPESWKQSLSLFALHSHATSADVRRIQVVPYNAITRTVLRVFTLDVL
jgi:hypothetical protein